MSSFVQCNPKVLSFVWTSLLNDGVCFDGVERVEEASKMLDYFDFFLVRDMIVFFRVKKGCSKYIHDDYERFERLKDVTAFSILSHTGKVCEPIEVWATFPEAWVLKHINDLDIEASAETYLEKKFGKEESLLFG